MLPACAASLGTCCVLSSLSALLRALKPFITRLPQLPDDFFDSAPPREEDAGDKPLAARGWSALSSMLPPPKNAAKKSTSKSSRERLPAP